MYENNQRLHEINQILFDAYTNKASNVDNDPYTNDENSKNEADSDRISTLPLKYKRSTDDYSDNSYEKRQLPFSGGIYGKRAVVPYLGGIYGKRAAVPFSGGIYGKRGGALPYSGGIYGKRSHNNNDNIKNTLKRQSALMPLNGGFFGRR